jgi:hypothetical protein
MEQGVNMYNTGSHTDMITISRVFLIKEEKQAKYKISTSTDLKQEWR